MDVTTLITRQAGNPLSSSDGLAESALLAMDPTPDIDAALKAVAIIAAARPEIPDPDGRRVVGDLADLMLRAALKGEDADVLAAALDRVALFDVGHLAHAAWLSADHAAKQHLARTVAGNAAACWKQWTAQAKKIGATYVEALCGEPRPEAALRAGGKAATRLKVIEDTVAQYERLEGSWRSLRQLISAGRDRSVFEISSRFDRSPAGMSWDEVGRLTRGQGLAALDVAVKYGLTDALVFDGAAACAERQAEQLAAVKAGGRSLAGTRNVKTYDMASDDSHLVRSGRAEAHGSTR